MTDTRRRLVLAGAVALIFAVSSNIAWLNPWPEKASFRGVDSVPFMWQYNQAAGVEILSAAYFPQTYRTYTDRINRPTYPFLIHTIGAVVGTIASPIVDLGPLERAGAGYVILKLLVFFFGAVAMFRILRRWMGPEPSLLATLLMLFHAHSIEFVATFHTTELQVITPIFVLWMFLGVCDRLSQPLAADTTTARRQRAARYGLIVAASVGLGVLMLAKQNYAIYLAILLFAAYKRRWLEAGVSVVAHLIPLAIYLAYLAAVDIPYVNHEAANYDQGVWLLDLFRQNPVLSIQQVMDSLWRSLLHLTGFFGVWLLLAVAALARRDRIGLTRDHLVFVGLFVFSTWAQIFAAARYYDYMMSDVAIVVFGLGAWFVWTFLERTIPDPPARRWVPSRSTISGAIVTVWFLANVLSFVHFPWVHPFDQPARNTEVLDNRLDMVENPDAFTDEQRARAHGGTLVDPTEENQ
mgnify:CR=1 FL=1